MKQAPYLMLFAVLLGCAMEPPPIRQATGSSVTIMGSAFSPQILNATAGQAITFTNQDGFAHSVEFTAVPAGVQVANSASLGQGATFQVTLTTPGTYQYRCGIHLSMTGSLVVK